MWSRRAVSIQASGTWGSTSRSKKARTLAGTPLVVGRVLPFGKPDALGVAKLRVRLGLAVLVPADLGFLVALGMGNEDRVEHRRSEPDVSVSGRSRQHRDECLPVLVQGVGHPLQKIQNGPLPFATLGFLPGATSL